MTPHPDSWPSRPRRIVGLMSGTSLDGIDAALIEVCGGIPPESWRQLAFFTRPYTPAERERIAALLQPQVSLPALTSANMWLGEIFAAAALEVIAQAGLCPEDVDAVASHGQTVWHIPPTNEASGATLQLGEPCVIAERTGILTVADFRPRDMAAGGQGAPLVPFADYLLFRNLRKSVAVLNIGGIANVTYLPRECTPAQVIAFDTGPGNMVIDALVTLQTQGRHTFDEDGQRAAHGTAQASLLQTLLDHPYFATRPPKSTGRETFGMAYTTQLWQTYQHAPALSPDDFVATVTALTVESIARGIDDFLLPHGPLNEIILGGGGSYNPTLRAMLSARLPDIPLVTHEAYGIASEAKEAIAFALLGHATLCGVPGNLPAATGAAHPVVLGKIVPGR